MNYKGIITLDPAMRSGKPCIRGMRMTVYDVLGYLASGMSHEQILADFPDLTNDDILACLAFAADREHTVVGVAANADHRAACTILAVGSTAAARGAVE